MHQITDDEQNPTLAPLRIKTHHGGTAYKYLSHRFFCIGSASKLQQSHELSIQNILFFIVINPFNFSLLHWHQIQIEKELSPAACKGEQFQTEKSLAPVNVLSYVL